MSDELELDDLLGDMTYVPDTAEEAAAKAEENGLTVLRATNRDVFVDLDDKASKVIFETRAEELEKRGAIKSYRLTTSKSGKWHGHVRLNKPASIWQRIALQCVLGSDLTREYLHYQTAFAKGDKTEVLFFEVKP